MTLNWLSALLVGPILLTIAWALGRPGAPPTPPILRWLLEVIGAILVVIGLILLVVLFAGGIHA